MAEPASKLPEEDRPDIRPEVRPDLRAREGLNSSPTSGGSKGASSSTGTRTAGTRNRTAASDDGARSGTRGPERPLYNPNDQTGETPANLRGAEEAPYESNDDDRLGKGYTPGNSSRTGRLRGRLRLTKRKAVIGLGASSIVSIIIGISSISQGPLEFIHIAQLLDKFHFSSQQNAQDSRLLKIARYIKDTHKPQNTRLGTVGVSVANKLDSKIVDATGFSSNFDTTSGRFKGYVGDRNHDQFKGKTKEQIKAQVAAQYGVDPSIVTVTDTEVHFNPETGIRNPVRAYSAQLKVARSMLGQAGLSKVSSYIGSRVLKTRAGWTFHPIKKLDSAIQAKALEGGKKALDKLKQQFQTDESNYVEGTIEKPGGDPKAKQTTDSKGNPIPDQNAQQTADGASSVKTDAQNIDPNNPQTVADATTSLTKKLTGGAAGAMGAICVLSSINKSIPALRQAKVVAPMMKMAGEAISLGSQAQSGQDISALQLGFFKDKLDSTDSSGNVTSSWNQAESIQAELGGPQNKKYDIPQEGQVFNGTSSPFDFLSNPLVDGVCSILGSTFGTIFNIVTGPVNFLISTVASNALLGPAASYLANWLSGAPISPLASGSDYGNYINYGARSAANEQYASAGGVQLSSTSEQQLADVSNSFDKADFQSHSLAYRIFNTRDSRTLAAHLIDNTGSAGPVSNVATLVHNFGNVFGAALRTPASLFTGITHAASTPYDWHGLKKVGFTTGELADSRFDNPFDNACYVVGNCKLANGQSITTAQGILNGPNGQSYIDRAKACFNITISGDSTNGWTTDSNTAAIDFQDGVYTSANCQDSGEDWLRIRFWLLDTPTIQGYDCYQSNTTTSDQSCQDVGFQSGGSSTNTPVSSPTGTLPTGSAQDLAKQLVPYLGNKITCNGGEGTKCSDISNTANGVSIKGGSCQVDALQPGVLGMLLELVQMGHSFVISALCSDHSTVDGLRGHNGGRAVDFNYIDGQFMGPDDVPWDNAKISKAEKFDQDIASFMPKSTGFGQIQCHPTFSFLQGFDTFDDACHHQHVQVET
jgi:hypothetical protein